jgi:hypothetical protein
MPETKCRVCKKKPVQCGFGLCFRCYHTDGVIERLVTHYRWGGGGKPLTGPMAWAERFVAAKPEAAVNGPPAPATLPPTVAFRRPPTNPRHGLKARGPLLSAGRRAALPSRDHPGHEERIAAHSERILGELAAIKARLKELRRRADAAPHANGTVIEDPSGAGHGVTRRPRE